MSADDLVESRTKKEKMLVEDSCWREYLEGGWARDGWRDVVGDGRRVVIYCIVLHREERAAKGKAL